MKTIVVVLLVASVIAIVECENGEDGQKGAKKKKQIINDDCTELNYGLIDDMRNEAEQRTSSMKTCMEEGMKASEGVNDIDRRCKAFHSGMSQCLNVQWLGKKDTKKN